MKDKEKILLDLTKIFVDYVYSLDDNSDLGFLPEEIVEKLKNECDIIDSILCKIENENSENLTDEEYTFLKKICKRAGVNVEDFLS